MTVSTLLLLHILSDIVYPAAAITTSYIKVGNLMYVITNHNEFRKAEARFSRLFDTVIERTGRYSSSAILEALGPAGAAEFRDLSDALAAYDQQRTFSAVLRSGDYRS